MLDPPDFLDPEFTAEEFQKIGLLTIRWAHIDHLIGNCLARLLLLSAEQARVVVFPLTEDRRMATINELAQKKRMKKDAVAALKEMNWVLPAIRSIRNNVVHTVVFQDETGEHHFELRSKMRRFSMEQVFAAEELTNYAAHAVLAFRLALGLKSGMGGRHALPDRPAVPECLRAYFQAKNPSRKERRRAQREPSRASRNHGLSAPRP